MQCDACDFQNPHGMKFCGECGAPLRPAGACAGCGFEKPPGFRFCGGYAAAATHPQRGGRPPSPVPERGRLPDMASTTPGARGVTGATVRLRALALGLALAALLAPRPSRALVDGDGDGLSDAFEIEHGFDPGTPGEQTLDPDLDGLDNLGEQAAGTNAQVADTDGDLRRDGAEVQQGTDPLDPDSFAPTVPALPAWAGVLLAALLCAGGHRRSLL